MLLKQPEIDLNCKNAQGQTLVHSIVQKFYESESEEQTIYLQYLKHLLVDSRRDLTLRNNDGHTILDIILAKIDPQGDAKENDQEMLKLLSPWLRSDDINEIADEKLKNLIISYHDLALSSSVLPLEGDSELQNLDASLLAVYGQPEVESTWCNLL